MTIFIGADHGGFAFKTEVKTWLSEWGYQVEDCGANQYDAADDYPQFAIAVAEKVVISEKKGMASKGILLCRSGGGMVIAANKVKGCRAIAVDSPQSVEHAVKHNHANVISLAADWLAADTVPAIIKTFLETEFSGEERHQRRLTQIAEYEQKPKI